MDSQWELLLQHQVKIWLYVHKKLNIAIKHGVLLKWCIEKRECGLVPLNKLKTTVDTLLGE